MSTNSKKKSSKKTDGGELAAIVTNVPTAYLKSRYEAAERAARAAAMDSTTPPAVMRELDEKRGIALVKLAAGRVNSVTRRAIDPLASVAGRIDASDAARERAHDSACNPVIMQLRAENGAAWRRLILADYDAAANDARLNDTIPDCMDVLQAAALSFCETAEQRADGSTLDTPRAVGKGNVCDMTAANRAAERYINGRRGLRASDARTIYIEDLSDADSARQYETLYRRAGTLAALANDTYIGDYTVQRVNAILDALNLTKTERRRLMKYINGDTFAAVADSEKCSLRAAAKSIYAARDKARAMLARAAADVAAARYDSIADNNPFTAAIDAAADSNTPDDVFMDMIARANAATAAPRPVYTSAYRARIIPAHSPAARLVAALLLVLSGMDTAAASVEWDIACYRNHARAAADSAADSARRAALAAHAARAAVADVAAAHAARAAADNARAAAADNAAALAAAANSAAAAARAAVAVAVYRAARADSTTPAADSAARAAARSTARDYAADVAAAVDSRAAAALAAADVAAARADSAAADNARRAALAAADNARAAARADSAAAHYARAAAAARAAANNARAARVSFRKQCELDAAAERAEKLANIYAVK